MGLNLFAMVAMLAMACALAWDIATRCMSGAFPRLNASNERRLRAIRLREGRCPDCASPRPDTMSGVDNARCDRCAGLSRRVG